MSKHNFLATFILISLIYLSYSAAPDVTPSAWTENTYVTACNIIGVPKIAEDQSTVVPLTVDNIYLKTSYSFRKFTNGDGNQAFDQNIFKYYIQISDTEGITTTLSISLISGNDGTNVTQTYVIQNTYELIDANGPYVLTKQTVGTTVYLNLYSFDMAPGATTVLLLTNADLSSTYPNQIFRSIQPYLITDTTDSLLTDSNYANIIGTVVSINTQTSTTVVRQILSSGIDAILYTFKMNNIGSDLYTNLVLGLQIQGSNFYTYISPLFGSGSTPPFTYANDQTALSTAGSLYSNNIVITFTRRMLVVTYDDLGENSNIFFLKNSKTTYALSVEAVTTSTSTVSNGLQYLTDYTSYVIQLNTDASVNTFFIIWADDENGFTYNFLNSLGDNQNNQIITDFSNNPKISTFMNGAFNADTTLSQTLYVWIYTSTSIIKYTFQVQQDASFNVVSNTMNKEFTAQLNENLLLNQVASNFQVTTQLKCVCQTPQVTEMICFYGTDACTFTVQNQPTFCVPNILK